MAIWFHHVEADGNSSDYSVTDWVAAEKEAVDIVRAGLHYVCDITIEAKINQLIYDGLWEEAVQYYNHYNTVKELILMREGCPVYKGGQ